MTCRHSSDDTSCSSHPNYNDPYKYASMPATPDTVNYSISLFQRVGPHLVLSVKYPNCRNCAYEGCKTMVFLDVTEAQAILWRKIDPHFRDPKTKVAANEAPSPAARFPGSAQGWEDALNYARGKTK